MLVHRPLLGDDLVDALLQSCLVQIPYGGMKEHSADPKLHDNLCDTESCALPFQHSERVSYSSDVATYISPLVIFTTFSMLQWDLGAFRKVPISS